MKRAVSLRRDDGVLQDWGKQIAKKEGHNIAVDYKTLNDNITTAIKNHLINVDALPPMTELLTLAGEITQVVFVELNKNGLTEEFFNRNLTTATPQAAAQGRA